MFYDKEDAAFNAFLVYASDQDYQQLVFLTVNAQLLKDNGIGTAEFNVDDGQKPIYKIFQREFLVDVIGVDDGKMSPENALKQALDWHGGLAYQKSLELPV